MSHLLNPYRLGAGAAPFAPLAIGSPDHAYWVEGPEFQAIGYAGNANIHTMPDEVGTADLVQATDANRMKYRAPVPGTSRAGAQGVSTDFLATAAWGGLLQPNDVVWVGVPYIVQGTQVCFIDGLGSGNRHAILTDTAPTPDQWRFGAASLFTGGTITTGISTIAIGHYDGASSFLEVNGTQVATGNVGTHTLTGIILGCTNSGTLPANFTSHIFAGVYSTPLTTQERADMVSGFTALLAQV